jgi:hypothetical protein
MSKLLRRAVLRPRTLRSAAARMVMAGFALSLFIGCDGTRESSSIASFLSYLAQDTAGAIAERTANVHCDSLMLSSFGFNEMGEGCWHIVADSLFYTFRGNNHKLLVRGKRVRIEAQRVQPLFDSLSIAITTHYSGGGSCKSYNLTDPYYARLYMWHHGSSTIYLHESVLTDSVALRPGLTVESVYGARSCAMEVGGPAARM